MDETVKHNLENLLKYQSVDIELRKLNNLIGKDEALVGMNKHKKAFNDAKQALSDCEQQSGSLISTYDELKKYVDDNAAMLAELEAAEPQTEEELTERVKKLESLKSKFQSADKKAHDMDERSKSICRARVEAIKSGNNAKQEYNKSKEKHGALVNSKANELNELKSKLESMRASLDQALFDDYQKLASENIFPPVVPARGDDKKGIFNCGGCGIGLSQQANTLLRDQGFCRCDHCRRIIVKLK